MKYRVWLEYENESIYADYSFIESAFNFLKNNIDSEDVICIGIEKIFDDEVEDDD